MTPFTPMALRDLYRELVKYPALAAELTDYQKDKLWRHAEDEAVEATRPIVDMMEGNPDYPYPEEYRNGREVEYLLSKHSPAYRDSQRVLQLLSAPPVRPLDTPAPVAAPAPGAAGAATDVKLAASPVDFALYIKEEYREKLLPFIKREYIGQKPQLLACMLIALKDLTALTIPLKENVVSLHAALEAFLGVAGTRAMLNKNLNDLDTASEKQHIKIQDQRNRIKTYMEQP